MGLALHCHGELRLTNGKMKEKGDTKREKELFRQALIDLQALQNMFFVPPTSKDAFSSSKLEEIG